MILDSATYRAGDDVGKFRIEAYEGAGVATWECSHCDSIFAIYKVEEIPEDTLGDTVIMDDGDYVFVPGYCPICGIDRGLWKENE